MQATASTIDALVKRLAQELPGEAAQFRMSPAARRGSYQISAHTRIACVLALLYPKDGELHIVFMRRTAKHPDKDRHAGQISFPGGKYEPEDGSHDRAALREAHEEVGVPPEAVQLLGRLSELYIPISDFMVYPFVGYAAERPDFVPEVEEVAEIIEVPISVLLDDDNRKVKTIELANGMRMKDTPYFDMNGYTLWGATSMMMSELVAVLQEVVSAGVE